MLLASDSRRSCGDSLGRDHISARGMMLLASDSLRSCWYSLTRDHILLLQMGVGGVLLASDSRCSCGYSLGREHISAFGMTLNMGVETLWCHAGLLGWAVCSGRRIRGIVVGSA